MTYKENEKRPFQNRRDNHNTEIARVFSFLPESIHLTHNKNSKNDKTRSLTLAIALFAIGGLVLSGLNYAGIARAQDDPVGTEAAMVETQESAVQYLTSDLKNQGELSFAFRWAPVTAIEGDTMTALFADCNNDETAISPMEMFENQDIQKIQSFPVAVPGDFMSWITVVNNAGEEPLQASTGVICVSEDDNDNDNNDVTLDATTKVIIQDTVNRVIQEGDTININHITQVYQNIVQNAVQIVNITGNNNTVNQVINQSANQIVESGGANVNQTIAQNAQQVVSTNITAAVPPTETPEEPVENTTALVVEEEQQTPLPFAQPIPPTVDPNTGGVDTPSEPITPPVEDEIDQELPPTEEEDTTTDGSDTDGEDTAGTEEESATTTETETADNAEVVGEETTDDSDGTTGSSDGE